MTLDTNKCDGGVRNTSGVTSMEMDMYEIRDALRIIGTSKARKFLTYMKRDMQRGRFNPEKYYERYLEAGGEGELMEERVSFLRGGKGIKMREEKGKYGKAN